MFAGWKIAILCALQTGILINLFFDGCQFFKKEKKRKRETEKN